MSDDDDELWANVDVDKIVEQQYAHGNAHQGGHAHGRPLQPSNHVQQQWPQGYQPPAPAHGGLPGAPAPGQPQGRAGDHYGKERAAGVQSHQHQQQQNYPPLQTQQLPVAAAQQGPQPWRPQQQQPNQQHPQQHPLQRPQQFSAPQAPPPPQQQQGHQPLQPSGQPQLQPLYPPLPQHQVQQQQQGHQPLQPSGQPQLQPLYPPLPQHQVQQQLQGHQPLQPSGQPQLQPLYPPLPQHQVQQQQQGHQPLQPSGQPQLQPLYPPLPQHQVQQQQQGHQPLQPSGQPQLQPLYPPLPQHQVQQQQQQQEAHHNHNDQQLWQQHRQHQPLPHGASVVAFPARQDRRGTEPQHLPPGQQLQGPPPPGPHQQPQQLRPPQQYAPPQQQQPQQQQQQQPLPQQQHPLPQQQQQLPQQQPQRQQPLEPQGLPPPSGQQRPQYPHPLQQYPHPLQQQQQRPQQPPPPQGPHGMPPPQGPHGMPPPQGQQQQTQPPQQQQKQQPQDTAKDRAQGSAAATNSTARPPPRTMTFTASLSLEEDKRFAVKVGYHEGLKAVFSLISGASAYDNNVKGWTFPLSQFKHVMGALKDGRLRTRGVQVTLQQVLPEFVSRMLQTAASRPNDERLYEKLTRKPHEAEQSLDEKMMPFQREGVRYGLKVGGRVLVGDEMGLGKTVQACCLLKCYSEDWPALVVVPKSLRETWADALFVWLKLTDNDVFVANSPADLEKLRGTQPAVRPQVIVVSYDTMYRAVEALKELKLKMVVLDEAHYIKNGKAQRTKAALPLIQHAKRAVLLTGTPALSRPAELVPLLQALVPSASVKATEFGERYSVPDRRYPGKYFGSRNEPELNKLLQLVMVRRLKKDVLTHLPPKRRQQIFVRLQEKDMSKLRIMGRELEGIKAVANSMMSAGGGSALAGVCREQQQTVMRLWRDTAWLKAEAVAEYCSDLLEADGAKFLLFAHHKVLLDAVEDKVKLCKARYIRIDGSTPSTARAESVKRFQEDADVKVAILSIQAAGVGLTMTASSLVVFAELSWVPGDIQQAEDRCHRIGQHTSVNIHYLLVRNSIDEIMWETLQTKLGNVGKVLDGSGAFIKVDATREVHGLGAGSAFTRLPLEAVPGGAAASPSPVDRAGPSAGAPARSPLPAAVPARSPLPAAVPQGGAIRGGSVRKAGKAAAAAAGTRRISDYFAPGGTTAGGAAGPQAKDGAAGAGAGGAGMKRGREPLGEGELLNDEDDDDRDFKKR
ncbi:hypothetical protein PLESTM_001890200 [Pleodorina starrii]|nr:hypothetical protein PLESTM_001890200 [Pleodorina starrii]